MHHLKSGNEAKGWLVGPWNSAVPIAVGWANEGISEQHLHEQMNEVYLVARGSSIAEVNGSEVRLEAGDCLVVGPGETHTFLESSEDYFHFVVHTPFVKDDKVVMD